MTIKVDIESEAKKPYEDLEKYEPWMNDTAQAAFEEGESITSVCVDLGISRETYYRWRDDTKHPFYQVARRGERMSQKYWEGIGKDGIIGGLDKFAGSSWQFVMKNRFRDSYSDAQKQEGNTAIEMLLNLLVEKNK